MAINRLTVNPFALTARPRFGMAKPCPDTTEAQREIFQQERCDDSTLKPCLDWVTIKANARGIEFQSPKGITYEQARPLMLPTRYWAPQDPGQPLTPQEAYYLEHIDGIDGSQPDHLISRKELAILYYHLAKLGGFSARESCIDEYELGVGKSLAYKNYLLDVARQAGLPPDKIEQLAKMLATNVFIATPKDVEESCDLFCHNPNEMAVELKTDIAVNNLVNMIGQMQSSVVTRHLLPQAEQLLFTLFLKSGNMPLLESLRQPDFLRYEFYERGLRRYQLSFKQTSLQDVGGGTYKYRSKVTVYDPTQPTEPLSETEKPAGTISLTPLESFSSNQYDEIPMVKLMQERVRDFFQQPATKAQLDGFLSRFEELFTDKTKFKEAFEPFYNRIVSEIYGIADPPKLVVCQNDPDIPMGCLAQYDQNEHATYLNLDGIMLLAQITNLELLEEKKMKRSESHGLKDKDLQVIVLSLLCNGLIHELMHDFQFQLANSRATADDHPSNQARIRDYKLNYDHYNDVTELLAVQGDDAEYGLQPIEADAFAVGDLAQSCIKELYPTQTPSADNVVPLPGGQLNQTA